MGLCDLWRRERSIRCPLLPSSPVLQFNNLNGTFVSYLFCRCRSGPLWILWKGLSMWGEQIEVAHACRALIVPREQLESASERPPGSSHMLTWLATKRRAAVPGNSARWRQRRGGEQPTMIQLRLGRCVWGVTGEFAEVLSARLWSHMPTKRPACGHSLQAIGG